MAKQSAKKIKTAAPIDGAVPTTELITEDNSEMNSVDISHTPIAPVTLLVPLMPLVPPGIVSPEAGTDLFADILPPADAPAVAAIGSDSSNDHTSTPEAQAATDEDTEEASNVINEDRLWRDDGWIARVISNDEDDGWAVEMTREGEREPTLIGPWTMGRDKKNPKPLDKPAFYTLVKTANEFRRRSEQQLQAQLHKSIWIDGEAGTIKVTLDIVPDDDFPYADLKAWDDNRELLAKAQVAATFRLNAESAEQWIANGYGRPR